MVGGGDASTPHPCAIPGLDADAVATIVEHLRTVDLLSCAATCTALRRLCTPRLDEKTLDVSGADLSNAHLLWLATTRLRGACSRVDVSGCAQLTKAAIARCVSDCPSLSELRALRVGPSSWLAAGATPQCTVPTPWHLPLGALLIRRTTCGYRSAAHLEKLVPTLPPSVARVELDVRLELKNDLHDHSPLLTLLHHHPALHAQRLTLVADNVSAQSSQQPSATDAAAAAAPAAAAPAPVVIDEEHEAAAGQEVEQEAEQEAAVAAESEEAEGSSAALRRLTSALLGNQAPSHHIYICTHARMHACMRPTQSCGA